jgi:glucosamine-6-phosphate deaminase
MVRRVVGPESHPTGEQEASVRVRLTVFADPAELGGVLATRIADGVEAAHRQRRRYVLGCPGGRSPMTTYDGLARLVRQRQLDLSGLVIAMMDDYVEPVGFDGATGSDGFQDADGFAHIAADLPHSCRRFGREIIVAPLSAAAGRGRGIPPEHLWVPDPAQPQAYDRKLADAGGVDLFVLASGASDGHVAFNPPGTPADSVSRVVPLATTTRQDNLVTFPHLQTLDNVPEHGVTVGIDTIRRHSKSAVMLVHGADKALAATRLSEAQAYDPEWPATVITECSNPDLYVDKAAIHASEPDVQPL